MNRIDKKFAFLRQRRLKAFIPFLTAGDPDLDATREIIMKAEGAGADLIELGFPFSDPVADGPTIQASYTRTLEKGQKTDDVFRMAGTLRGECDIPVVAMISYSLVFRMGFERFLQTALDAGIDGATIPDLPAEEAEKFTPLCGKAGFHLIGFVTPATTAQRRKLLVSMSGGFVYYIAVRGITGERNSMPEDLKENLSLLRNETALPVAVGFGISDASQARSAAEPADGVIVGSAIVRRIEESRRNGLDPVSEALKFIQEMSDAVKGKT